MSDPEGSPSPKPTPTAGPPKLFDLFGPERIGKDLERLIALSLLAAALTSTLLPIFQSHPPLVEEPDRLMTVLATLAKNQPTHPFLLSISGLVLLAFAAFFGVQVSLGLWQMRHPKERLYPEEEDATRTPPPWGLADFALVFVYQQFGARLLLILAIAVFSAVPHLTIDGERRIDLWTASRVSFGETAGIESVTTSVKVPGAAHPRAVISHDAGRLVCHMLPEAPGDPALSLNGHKFAGGERELAVGDELRIGSLVARYDAPSNLFLFSLQSMATLSIAAFTIFIARRRGGTLADLGLKTDGALPEAGRGVVAYLAGLPLVFLAMLASWFLCKAVGVAYESHELLRILDTDRSPGTAIGVVVLAAIVAPVTEEIIFRGFLTRALRRPHASRLASAAISSFFFGAMHEGLASKLPISVVGGVFATTYLTSRRGSLVGAIVAHMCFNGVMIAITLVMLRVG